MMTFGAILQTYLERLKTEQRPSASRYAQIYYQFFNVPTWRDRPACSITRHEILYFKQTHEATPTQCNKALDFIKQAYNWASDRIDPATMQPCYDGHNPALRMKKCDVLSRERMMDLVEIRILLTILTRYGMQQRAIELVAGSRRRRTWFYEAFFVTRLLTPCRIKELCELKWSDVDWLTGKWRKQTTKNGRSQYVLIPRQALALLLQLPTKESVYVFAGSYGHHWQPDSAAAAWGKIRKVANLPDDLQLLDFRRTLASYLYTEIKADDLTAKAVLNHYDGRPVAIYTRLNYDRLALILQQYADWIWALKEPVKPVVIQKYQRRLSDQAMAL